MIFISIPASARETVVFAIDIIRHGDRTPINDIPNYPYQWAQGFGELTPLGMEQEFNLGQKFRNTYVNQYGLLPPKYDVQTMYIRSSDFNRTLMSAQSLLLGLYPIGTGPILDNRYPALPSRYQPIPIHTVPQDEDSLLLPERNESKIVIKKTDADTKELLEKSAQYKTKLQKWSRITGASSNLSDITSLANNLYIRTIHHVAVPKGLSNSDVKEIIDLGNWVAAVSYKPYEIGALGSKKLRLEIAKYLKNATMPESKLKYVLFSAHDSTLMAMMSALHNPLDEIPPYASDLRFLLIKNTETENYYVQVTFNEKKLNLKQCSGKCSISDFLKYLDSN